MFKNLRRSLLGFAVIASSIAVVPVAVHVATASNGSIDGSTWSPASGGFAKFDMAFTESSNSVTFKAKTAVETSSGGLLVAGYVGDIGTFATQFALVRITNGGVVDTAFDSNGLKILDRGTGNGAADFIQSSGSDYFVGGWSGSGQNRRAAVVKVNESGVIDSQWGSSGWAEASSAYARYEGAATGKQGEKAFFIDGTQIVMWSEDSAATEIIIHRFDVSTGLLMTSGGPISNPVSIDRTIFSTGFLADNPETFVMLSNTTMLIATRSGAGNDNSKLYKIDLGVTPAALDTNYGTNGILETQVKSYHLEDFRFGKNNSYNTRIFLAGSSNSPDTYIVRLNTDGTVDTSSYGPSSWGNMTNSPGYIEIGSFNLASGDIEFLADSEMLISGAGSGFNYQLRKYNTTTNGSANSLFGNSFESGVVSISNSCNVIQSGWLVPISGGSNFFLMGPKTFTVNQTSVNGIGALKFVGSGNAATACDGLPAPMQVAYSQPSYSGTAMQPISIPAPNVTGNLGSVVFSVNNLSQSLPSGLTITPFTGAISGAATTSTGGSIMVGITATYSANGITQTGRTTISIDIASASGGGIGGPGGGGLGGGGLGGGGLGGGGTPCVAGTPSSTNSAVTFDSAFAGDGGYDFSDQLLTSKYGKAAKGPNGALYVAVSVGSVNTTSATNKTTQVIRFLADGTTDSTWGNASADLNSSTGYSETATGLLVLSDGSVVMLIKGATAQPRDYELAKFTSAGVLDTTFGVGGLATLVSGSTTVTLGSLAEGPAGSIYVGKSVTTGSYPNFLTTFGIIKVSALGVVDSTFGTGGELGVNSSAMATDSTGALYVGGLTNSSPANATVVKYATSGAIDTTFGVGGVVELNTSTGSSDEYLGGLVFANGKISGTVYISSFANNSMSFAVSAFRMSTAGVLDTSFDTDGVASVGTLGGPPRDITVLSDGGLVLPVSAVVNNAPSLNLVGILANGTPVANLATSPAKISSGTCELGSGSIVATAAGIFAAGTSGNQTVASHIFKISISDMAAGSDSGSGGGSTTTSTSVPSSSSTSSTSVPSSSSTTSTSVPSSSSTTSTSVPSSSSSSSTSVPSSSSTTPGTTPSTTPGTTPSTTPSSSPSTTSPSSSGVTPALVTSSNAATLVRTPGSESIIVNGTEVSIETKVLDVPAARTPDAQRTPAQVAAIQQAGAALLQQFLASLPAGATSNVVVVNTATGAVMQNLVFDANGNSINVPVEDIVFLDGPQLSLMIGSNNANITADGKYQVGAGGIIGVTGAGLGAGLSGEVVAMSTPTLLANFQTTAAGDFNKSAKLPSSLGVGDHTLVVAAGSTYAMMGIRVVPAALPATGSSSERVIIIALFTLVFGALFFRGRRITLF